MKRGILVLFAAIVLTGSAFGQYEFQKKRLFKVDPMSALFREFRVSVENHLFDNFFWYLSPYGHHQTWLNKASENFDRPEHPQKKWGLGMRFGLRRYFFPKDKSPAGFFLHVMGGYRLSWVQNLNNNLIFTDKTHFHEIGAGAMIGYQWLYGPKHKNNFVYGFMGGFEYYPLAFYQDGYGPGDFAKRWYELHFLGNDHFLNGFRIYLGIEVGFAFRQKRLHW